MRIRRWIGVIAVSSLATLTLGLLASVAAQRAQQGGKGNEIYLVPFSHLDFLWGGTREECLARGNQIISKAIKLAKQYREFRFLLEDDDFVANFVETRRGSGELADLKRLVKQGRIEIAPKWAGIFQNLPDGEVLSRNLVYGKRYARTVFGVDPQVAHMGDIPGFTPQFPQMLRKADIPFMVMTRMGPADLSLFYWKAPDGSKELVWQTLKGYGWGAHAGLHADWNERRKEALAKELDQVRATTRGPIFMNWGTDLWAPTEKLIENVDALNKDGSLGRFILSTPAEFFRQVANTPELSVVSGEIPSSWPYVVSSLPHMWPLAVPATETLLTAEKFAAINYALGYADYPQSAFDFLWKKLIESMDHNHDGQGGSIADERKIGYSQLALLRGGEIQRDMLRNIAERVEVLVPKSFPIVVFNPQGWTRTDVVRAHVTLYGEVAPGDIAAYRKGLRMVDATGKSIAFCLEQYSENISRALEMVFVASDVPPLGYKTYYLVAAEQPDVFPKASEIKLDSSNDLKDPRRPLGSDVAENDFYRVTVDKGTGRVSLFDKALGRDVTKDMEIVAVEERGGNYVSIEAPTGRTIVNSISNVAVEENNPVRTVIRIVGQVIDMPVDQRVILYRDLKRIDIENTVQWKGPRFVRLEQLFPLDQAKAHIQYGVPFGSTAADNVVPKSGPRAQDEIQRESWLQTRQIQNWIFAGASGWGLTIASDHQLVRVDTNSIRAEMLRGVRFTSVKVVRGDEVTSLHYPPPGTYAFKYSLSSGAGDWKTTLSYQAGLNFNAPLVAVSVVDEISQKSLPPTYSFCSVQSNQLVVSALKKSDLDASILLRVYEIQGSKSERSVEFLGRQRTFREVNLLEEDVDGGPHEVLRVSPYEIKTIKLAFEK